MERHLDNDKGTENMNLLIVILLPCALAEVSFIILHNNDMHARFEELDRSVGKKFVGGMARTAYKVKEFRKAAKEKRGPPVLFLNAGDTFTGTIWFSIHRWKIASEFMNLLRPDAVSLGNHEFDDGLTNLTLLIRSVPFPVLCCNCFIKKELNLGNIFQNSTVLNVSDTKVGVIGYLLPETAHTNPCENVTFTDEIQAIRAEANKLSKQGIKIILAVGHSGFETDKRIAREVKGIDAVIGGHSNTFLWNGRQPDLEKPVDSYPKIIYSYEGVKVPVVQAFAYTKYLGYLEVNFNDKGQLLSWKGNPIFMNDRIPKDESVQQLVGTYRKEIGDVQSIIVGETFNRLDDLSCRYEECNIGNLVADAFVFYKTDNYRGPHWTNCAIGFVNSGSLKNSIDPGNVTLLDILEVVPFFQDLVSFEITGRDLEKTLEMGVRAATISEVRGEFLQVAGLKIVFNRSKPPGSRTVKVLARCSNCSKPKYFPLEHDLYYTVITTQFIANGGDHREFLNRYTNLTKYEGIKDYQAVTQYFEKVGIANHTVEDRITFVHEKKSSLIKTSLEDITNNKTASGVRGNEGCLSKEIVIFGFVICCLGSHDFDDGIKNLSQFVEKATFNIVSCNTIFNNELLDKLVKPSVTFTIGKLKVGVIGVLTISKYMANSGKTKFINEMVSVRKEASHLKEIGTQVVIVLSHLGYNLDLKMAKEVEEVDLIVGGYSNTFLHNGNQPDLEKPVDYYPKNILKPSGKLTLVVQAFAYTKYLGVLNVTFSDKGGLIDFSGQVIFLSNAAPKDPEVEKLTKEYKMLTTYETQKVIGNSKYFLSGFECQYSECNLGNLLTDALIDYMQDENKTPYWSSCAIAIVNGGSMRKSINAGPVSVGDIHEAYPYYQQLVMFEITGKTLVNSLEMSARSESGNQFNGEFLQGSGLIVVFDRTRKPKSRVLSVEVRCLEYKKPEYYPVDLEATYKIITNIFLANSGDEQYELSNKKRNVKLINIIDTEAAIRYFKKHESVAIGLGSRSRVAYTRNENSVILKINKWVIFFFLGLLLAVSVSK